MIVRRLLIALLVAVLVSGVFTFWLSKRVGAQHTKSSKLQYIATSAGLDAGTVLRPADLQRIDWPGNMPLDGAFLKSEDVAGRTLLYPLAKGEPILQRQLSAPGQGVGLSSKIPDGMRAISLKSNEVVGVAGFLLPGTHIDILVTYHTPGSTEPVTSTVLQDVRILAAGQKTQPDPEGKATTVDVVTILVTPYDAEKVVLASSQGTVHFVLRNGVDHARGTDPPAQLSELGDAATTKPVARVNPKKTDAVALPKPYYVDTARGDKHTVETF
jgi:pilus assembly protein CpaB